MNETKYDRFSSPAVCTAHYIVPSLLNFWISTVMSDPKHCILQIHTTVYAAQEMVVSQKQGKKEVKHKVWKTRLSHGWRCACSTSGSFFSPATHQAYKGNSNLALLNFLAWLDFLCPRQISLASCVLSTFEPEATHRLNINILPDCISRTS